MRIPNNTERDKYGKTQSHRIPMNFGSVNKENYSDGHEEGF